MPRTTIATAAAEELDRHRALTTQELARSIVGRGLTRAKNPDRAVTRALAADPRFRQLADGRWVSPGRLLAGAVLAHRLTAEEAANASLALTEDLAPLASLAGIDLLTEDGQRLGMHWGAVAREKTGIDADLALEGPPGWLPGRPGALVHVRLTGSLVRVTEGLESSAETRLAVRRIAELCRTRLSAGAERTRDFFPPVVSLGEFLLQVLVEEPEALTPSLPPLAEALSDAGLEVHGEWVGLPGTDWDLVEDLFAPDDWDRWDDWDGAEDGAIDDIELDDDGTELSDAEFAARMAELFGLDEMEVEGLGILLGAAELARQTGGIEDPAVNAKLATIMSMPGIARAIGFVAWQDPELEAFVTPIAQAARRGDAAGPRAILGALAEAREDVAGAERAFRSALEADPDHPVALVEVARFEMERSRLGDALRLLRRAGVPPDSPERIWLEAMVAPAGPKVGRNEPCPCGSGRKYKVCHLGAPAPGSDPGPAALLLHKLGLWLTQPDVARLVDELRDEAGGDPGETRAPAEILASDIVLFERGQLERCLRVRAGLLPERELALGRSWLSSRRSLYEVRQVRAEASITVRDLRSDGEPFEVPDRSLSRLVAPLDLICMRLLPDGSGGVLATDGILVPRSQRRRVLDVLEAGDGVDLLRWIALPPLMPRLQNTEGEPLRFVTIEYRVPDPRAAAAALRRKLGDGEGGRFVETVARRGEDWIRGSITLDGDRATIEANSSKRARRLERTLLRAAPGAALIRHEELGPEDLQARARAGAGMAEQLDPAEHPEVGRALDEFVRRREAAWVDEPIPALAGLTPRQALADDRARPELEALLDDFTWANRRSGGGPGTMDPDRLRALLGMER